jgi:c-di-GMP-binding flagellar brake protein YcgR
VTLRDAVHRIASAVPGRRYPGGDDRREAASGDSPPPAQRRDDVRIAFISDVFVGRPGFPMLRCTSVDLSGSGLRALASGLELREGDEVDVFLRMEDGFEVEARAVVVRSVEPGISAFRFVAIEPHLRELLIRHVFADQQRTLALAKVRA